MFTLGSWLKHVFFTIIWFILLYVLCFTYVSETFIEEWKFCLSSFLFSFSSWSFFILKRILHLQSISFSSLQSSVVVRFSYKNIAYKNLKSCKNHAKKMTKLWKLKISTFMVQRTFKIIRHFKIFKLRTFWGVNRKDNIKASLTLNFWRSYTS